MGERREREGRGEMMRGGEEKREGEGNGRIAERTRSVWKRRRRRKR